MAQPARRLAPEPAPSHRPRLRAVPPPRARRPSPAVIRRRRAVALAGLGALVLLPLAALRVGGGGGASGDAAAIAALLRAGASEPASLCDHLSPAMLAAAGGHAACVRSSPSRGPAATVGGVRIDGVTATAVVHRPDADELVRLVKRGGAWVVDDVH